MGAQKNRFTETFEHPKQMFKLMDKKIITIVCPKFSIRPNKKNTCVTRLYLNLLMKPRLFSGFLEKNIIMYFESLEKKI